MGAYERKKPVKRRKKRRIWPFVLAGALLLALVCAGVAGALLLRDDGRIVNNVYIAGIPVGGMTMDEARAALKVGIAYDQDVTVRLLTAYPEYSSYTTTYDIKKDEPVDEFGAPYLSNSVEKGPPVDGIKATTVRPEEVIDGRTFWLDRSVVFSAQEADIEFDVDAVLQRVYAMGRSGSIFSRVRSNMYLSRYDVDISEDLHVNETALRSRIETLRAEVLQTGAQTLVRKEPEALHLTLGALSRSLDDDALYDAVLQAFLTGTQSVTAIYQEVAPEPIDLDALYAQYCTAPVNAVCDSKTYEITDETVGFGFRMAEAVAALDAAKPGDSLTLPLTELVPQHTRASIEAHLFGDVLAAFDSPHVYHPRRTTNLELVCKEIDGYVVKPGETFSFNEVVGERTAEKGYQKAGVYVGGATVDQLGGGICQVASVLYWCTLKSELEVVERAEHAYVPDYVPWGMDATIYWGIFDYRFRNQTEYPVKIEASVSGGYVHMRFLGTETRDYTVVLSYKASNKNAHTTKTVDISPDMKNYDAYKSYKEGDVIQVGYDGWFVRTYRERYRNGTLLSSEQVNTSSYARRDKLVAHLVSAADPTPKPTPAPTEPTPEPTPAPTEPTPEPTPAPTEPTPEPTEAPPEE